MFKSTDINIDAFAAKAEAMPIQGGSYGLFYLVKDEDKNRVAIAAHGCVVLTVKQARALLKDLPGILKEYCKE
jgi:hypothetical protein